MRIAVLVLLVPLSAHADTRVGLRLAGGIEGGTVTGVPRPDGVVEAGLAASTRPDDRWWGVGIVLERVGRQTEDMPIASEHELDIELVITNSDHTFRAGVGMGVRRLAIAGAADRPASTVWGLDLVRFDNAKQLIRRGNMALDAYYAWTFGLYDGEITMERVGDMAYPTRDVWAVTTTYVVGLQTTIVW